MNCDRAGELLGAYLRDDLSPSTRAEVQAHLNQCAACSADLDLDRLVFNLPREEPSASLHDRIFSSAEFREIAQAVSLYNAPSAGEARQEGHLPSRNDSASGTEHFNGNGHHSRVLVLRPNKKVARVESNGHHPGPRPAERSPRQVNWQRLALQLAAAAAVLVLILGSAFLVKTLVGSKSPVAVVPTYDIQAPVTGPLTAGNRVVYLHDGRLWSAPETGSQSRSPLTGTQVTVAPGWAVAPAAGPDGRHHLAYIDLKTGTLHFIQTDDSNDVTIAHVAPPAANLAAFWQSAEGKAVLAGLAWSPDARQIAFVADPDGAGAALWVVNADGSAARPVSGAASAGALPLLPAWASDGANLAYALAQDGATSIWNYAFDGAAASMLEQQAAPRGDASDVVRALFWTKDTLNPTLTWSEGAPNAVLIKGLWSYRLNQTPHLVQLTSTGAIYSTVDYSPLAGSTGAWLVGQVGAGLRSIYADGSERDGLASGQIAAARWSPDGSSAVYIVAAPGATTGTLWDWTPLLGQRQIAEHVALTPLPVWSPDTQQVLYAANGQVLSATTDGHSEPLDHISAVTTFAWAPDGTRIAFAAGQGIMVSNRNGGALKQVDNVTGVSNLVWTAVP